jgi:hypothetical protein
MYHFSAQDWPSQNLQELASPTSSGARFQLVRRFLPVLWSVVIQKNSLEACVEKKYNLDTMLEQITEEN